MKKISVIKIDPAKRLVAKIQIDRRPQALFAMCGQTARKETIAMIDGNPVVLVCPDKDKVKAGPGFRFRGHDKHALGVSLIVGLHAQRAVNAPVDAAWVTRMIEWIDA